MKIKAIQTVFILLTGLIICIPLLLGIIGIDENVDLSENRTLAEAPTFSLDKIAEFPSEFDAYYNDNFPTRSYCVQAYNLLCYYLLNQGYNDTLVIGDDKWIFYQTSHYSNDFKRNNLMSEEDLKSIADYLSLIKEYCESIGSEFYFVCAPNKNEVYPEKMPSRIKQCGDVSVLDQLEEYLINNTDIKVINVKDAIIENKEDPKLYYSNGTHWNYYGSFIGYQEIMKTITADFPDIPIVQEDALVERIDDQFINYFFGKSVWGDYDVYYSMKPDLESIPFTLQEADIPQRFGTNYRGGLIMTHNPNMSEKLFVFRDSFSTFLIPYLSYSFKDCSYCWRLTEEISFDMISEQKPTVFLYEILERRIPNLLDVSQKFSYPVNNVSENLVRTGNMVFATDKVENNISEVIVTGWSYLEDRDTANQKKYIRFNLADNSHVDYRVGSYYSNIGDYFQNNKYDYARFTASIPISNFMADIVSYQYIIEDSGEYYIGSEITFPAVEKAIEQISPVSSIDQLEHSDEYKQAIDIAEKTKDGSQISVKGWCYISGCDTEKQTKYVRFNLSDGSCLDFEADSYFSDIGDYFGNNLYDYARFSLSIPAEKLSIPVSSIQLIILENGIYYTGDSVDCVIEQISPVSSIDQLEHSDEYKQAIDIAEKTKDGSQISVKGWCYISGCDTEKQTKYVRFNLSDGSCLDFEADSYFSDIGDYFGNNLYDYARFSLSIPAEKLSIPVSSIQLIILENGIYYTGDSVDCVIE